MGADGAPIRHANVRLSSRQRQLERNRQQLRLDTEIVPLFPVEVTSTTPTNVFSQTLLPRPLPSPERAATRCPKVIRKRVASQTAPPPSSMPLNIGIHPHDAPTFAGLSVLHLQVGAGHQDGEVQEAHVGLCLCPLHHRRCQHHFRICR